MSERADRFEAAENLEAYVQAVGVQFLLTELQAGLALLDVAATSELKEANERRRALALDAYEVVSQQLARSGKSAVMLSDDTQRQSPASTRSSPSASADHTSRRMPNATRRDLRRYYCIVTTKRPASIRTLTARMPSARQAAGVAPLIALMALACSGDPSGPKNGDAPGTFTATLTGAASATLTGTATFVAQEGQGYEVEMLPRGSTNGSGLWITAGNGRPAVGSYAVTPFTTPQSLPTAIVRFCANTSGACYTDWGAYWETAAGAGRLEITQSTATALAGSLDVDLRTDTGNVSGGGPLTHVSARFNATCSLTDGC